MCFCRLFIASLSRHKSVRSAPLVMAAAAIVTIRPMEDDMKAARVEIESSDQRALDLVDS